MSAEQLAQIKNIYNWFYMVDMAGGLALIDKNLSLRKNIKAVYSTKRNKIKQRLLKVLENNQAI